MKKSTVLWIFLILIVGIQLIQPAKNQTELATDNESIVDLEVPLEVVEILKASCFDCHSNHTNYPWYSRIAPISWVMAHHISEGKEHLNFSEWQHYNAYQKEHLLEELNEAIEDHKMPLKSYLLMHEEAQLGHQEQQYILEWVTLTQLNME